MKHGKSFTMAGILIAAVALVSYGSEHENGWKKLFNGKDLTGWKQINGTADYKVDDGTILGTTKEGSPNSFLCTRRDYCDFILEFDVKVDPRLNSGVQIRSLSKPDYKNGRVHGYQVEIDSDGDAGFIYDEARRGWLSTERSDPEKRNAFEKGEWNHYKVLCVGDTIVTWVNGTLIADIKDDMTDCGFIGLQVHSFRGDTPAWVRWKNIRIKEIEVK